MFLIIDNYDSFVHNLARYFVLAECDVKVVRNDAITAKDITAMRPESIIISPGPCSPDEAGSCLDIVKKFGATTPILGVCLGQQVIGQAYGAPTMRAQHPLHGRASAMTHDGQGVFRALPSPMNVGRYHSLINDFSECKDLTVNAQTENGEPMAVHHKIHPVHGVQFHPESILTENGLAMVQNFVRIVHDFHLEKRSLSHG